MIPLTPADEPKNFDSIVRQKGNSAILELAGQAPSIKRRGPPRKPIANRPEDIHPKKFPAFWQDCLPELHRAYGGVCAYACMYIDSAIGASTVDHYLPKSSRIDLIYEWGNYRLACLRMNARKGDRSGVLDPFEIGEGWFRIEFVGFQIFANPDCSAQIRSAVDRTIAILGLSDDLFCESRREYYHLYMEGGVSLEYLRRRCPLLAYEIIRQGRLRSPAPRSNVDASSDIMIGSTSILETASDTFTAAISRES